MRQFLGKRITATVSLMALLAGAAVPAPLWAQSGAASQAQPAETLEALLSELRNTVPNAISREQFEKLNAFIKNNKPDLKPLVYELETSKSVELRSALIAVLPWNADQAAPALPALIRIASSDSSQKLRSRVMMMLSEMRLSAGSALGPLQTIVQNEKEEPSLRLYAAKALGGMGPAAKRAYGAIFDLLVSDQTYLEPLNAHVAGNYLGTALREIDPSPEAMATLVGLLQKKNTPAIRSAVNLALYRTKPESITPALAQVLFDLLAGEQTSAMRAPIVKALGQARNLTDGQIDILVVALQRAEDWYERKALANILQGSQALTRKPVLEAFREILKIPADGSAGSGDIARMLTKTGDVSAQRVVLDAMRECPDDRSRRILAGALSAAAPLKPELVADILAMHRTAENSTDKSTLYMLLFDVADGSSLPLIEQAEEEEKDTFSALRLHELARQLREKETGVAGKVKPGQSLETLLAEVRNAGPATDGMVLALKISEFVKDNKPDLQPLVFELANNKSAVQRSILLMALMQNQDQASPALPALMAIARQDESQNLRGMALQTMANMRLRDVSIIEPLQEIVQNEKDTPLIRVYAANALGSMGPVAKPAYKAVLDLLLSIRDYPDALNAHVAGSFLGESLRRIDSSPEAEMALVALLDKRDDTAVRAAVARALTGRPGGLTPDMVQALIDALAKEGESTTRQSIARALGQARNPTDGQVEALAAALERADEWQECYVLTDALQSMQVLTRKPVLEALRKVLAYPADDSTSSDIARMVLKSGDVAAQRLVIEALRACPDKRSCGNLGSAVSATAPLKPELFDDMFSLFRSTKNETIRDALGWALMEADSSVLPILEKAREEEKLGTNVDMMSRLSMIIMKIQHRESAKTQGK